MAFLIVRLKALRYLGNLAIVSSLGPFQQEIGKRRVCLLEYETHWL